MKKISKLLVLLLLIMPLTVMADMGAPYIEPYDLIVTDSNGVDYYSDYQLTNVKGHIDKDTVITIDYEDTNMYMIKVDGQSGYLKSLDGLKSIKESVKPEEISGDAVVKYDTKQKALVYAKDGVDVQTGPGEGYDKVTTIKKGTEIEYEYSMGKGSQTTYLYVETSEGNGWVSLSDSKVLTTTDEEFIFRVDVETECGTIPANTILKSVYESNMWSRSNLFTYKGCNTLQKTFRSSDILQLIGGKYTANALLTIYSKADTSSEVLGTIPSGETFINMASYSEEGGEMFTNGFFYVEYNNVKGWAALSNGDFTFVEKVTLESQATVVEEPKKEEPKEEPKKEVKKDDPKKTEGKSSLSGETIVIISVVGGVALALGAVAIIVLVNKNKKKKKVEQTTEVENKTE